jgi:hypothetical protein
MRRFIRHPTDIPIEVLQGTREGDAQPLRDVSHGGLSFRYPQPVAVGHIIRMRIALTQPVFETDARVIWCQAEGAAWQVGVEFLDPQDRFRARMVEQVCHIEQYRREQSDHAGRQLTSHEAALEWIEKFASVFPRSDEL